MVVDGTSPGSVNMAVATVDAEIIAGASTEIEAVTFKAKGATDAHAACVVEDLPDDGDQDEVFNVGDASKADRDASFLIYKESQKTTMMTEANLDLSQSPIQTSFCWAAAPARTQKNLRYFFLAV